MFLCSNSEGRHTVPEVKSDKKKYRARNFLTAEIKEITNNRTPDPGQRENKPK